MIVNSFGCPLCKKPLKQITASSDLRLCDTVGCNMAYFDVKKKAYTIVHYPAHYVEGVKP